LVYSSAQSMQNNTLVGNEAAGRGGTIWATGLATSFVNNIVAYTQAGDGLYLDDSGSDSASSWSFSDWMDNSAQHTSGFSSLDTSADGNLSVDPGFVDYSLDGDCSNDLLTLLTTSALVDAGDPAILDADGTSSDMGAESVLPAEEDLKDTGLRDTARPDTGSPRDTAEPEDTAVTPVDSGEDSGDDSGAPSTDDSGAVHSSDSAGSETGDSADEEGSSVAPPSCGCAAARARPGLYGGIFFLLLYGRRRRRSTGILKSQARLSMPPAELHPPA
jgi:hypothetical protein